MNLLSHNGLENLKTHVPQRNDNVVVFTYPDRLSPQQQFDAAVAIITGEKRADTPEASNVAAQRTSFESFESSLLTSLDKNYQYSVKSKIGAMQVREKLNPSGIPLDQLTCDIVAEISRGNSAGNDVLSKTLPGLRLSELEKGKEVGLNCRMASAMLVLALRDLGYKDARIALQEGHTVVIRTMSDTPNEIIIYDPTSLSIRDGKQHAYVKKWAIADVQKTSQGIKFNIPTLSSALSPDVGIGKEKSFFIPHDYTICDPQTMLEDVCEISAIATQESERSYFDQGKYKEELLKYVCKTSDKTENQIREIVGKNPQVLQELISVAQDAFEKNNIVPDPFHILEAVGIATDRIVGTPPDPRDFKNSSGENLRKKAQDLVHKYPQLTKLHLAEILDVASVQALAA